MVKCICRPLVFPASCIVACWLILTSCDDNEPCTGCGQISSTFSHERFSVFIEGVDTFLIQYDSGENVSIFFPLCSSELLSPFETENIVEASGSFRKQCSESDIDRIDVNEIEWLDSCLPPIPQLDGPYDLDNMWLIHYIQTPDTILYTPCEGSGFVTFDTSEETIHGVPAINSYLGTYTMINDSTLQMPDDFVMTLSVGNRSQTYFDRRYYDVISPRSVITYSVHKNILILRNKAANSMIRLFLPG